MVDSMDAWELIEDIPFFAFPPDRKLKGMIPVFAENPLFYGLPELDENTLDGIRELCLSPMVVPLYEFQHKDGTYFYSVDSEKEGMKRSEKPVCRVWKNPSSVLTLDWKAKR